MTIDQGSIHPNDDYDVKARNDVARNDVQMYSNAMYRCGDLELGTPDTICHQLIPR